jgi:hypothetical protein
MKRSSPLSQADAREAPHDLTKSRARRCTKTLGRYLLKAVAGVELCSEVYL